MYFDRFDICAAWYIFCVQYHSGQNSFLYRKLSQLTRMRFKPGSSTENLRFTNENQMVIFANLMHKYQKEIKALEKICQKCKKPLELHRQNELNCCDCVNIIYMCTSGWLDRDRSKGYFDDGLGE